MSGNVIFHLEFASGSKTSGKGSPSVKTMSVVHTRSFAYGEEKIREMSEKLSEYLKWETDSLRVRTFLSSLMKGINLETAKDSPWKMKDAAWLPMDARVLGTGKLDAPYFFIFEFRLEKNHGKKADLSAWAEKATNDVVSLVKQVFKDDPVWISELSSGPVDLTDLNGRMDSLSEADRLMGKAAPGRTPVKAGRSSGL